MAKNRRPNRRASDAARQTRQRFGASQKPAAQQALPQKSKFDAACRKAAQLIEASDFAGAIALLEPLDPVKNRDAPSLHFLGLAKVRNGQLQEGLSMLERSVLASPDQGWMRINLAAVLQGRGDHERAQEELLEAVRLAPEASEAWSNLAATKSILRDFEGAAEAAERAASLNPKSAPALIAHANALTRAGDHAAAAGRFRAAVALEPRRLHAHVGLLQALHKMEDADAAASVIEDIAQLLGAETIDGRQVNPNNAHMDKAVSSSLNQAAASKTVSQGAVVAMALEAIGQYENALQAANEAITADPLDAFAHAAKGITLYRMDQRMESIPSFEAALAIRPDWPEIQGSLGNAYIHADETARGIAALQKAAELDPTSASIQTSLGAAHWEAGDLVAAEAAHAQAVQLAPEVGSYGMHLGIAQMRQKNFADGEANYNRRWETDGFADQIRPHKQPIWQGENLAGKKILIAAEQGVGDEVMYAGMLQKLVEQGAAVFYETGGRLFELLERSLPGVMFGRSQNPPAPIFSSDDFDYRLMAGSLMFRVADSGGALQPKTAYLKPEPSLTERLRAKYRAPDEDGSAPNLVVGIAWKSGNPVNGVRRTAGLDLWGPVFETPGVRFVNLQYGDVDAEIRDAEAKFNCTIIQDDEVDAKGNLDPFAAQVASLDLVVSTDNSTVHFAGALGVPTIMLLNHEPDWRWFGAEEANRWYESVAHIRQETAYDWAPVLEAVGGVVKDAAAGGPLPVATDPARAPMANVGARPKALVVNDTTTWYHWGCTATSLAIRDNIVAKGYDVAALPIRQVYATRPAPTTVQDFDDPAFFQRFVAANPSLVRALAESDRIVINGEGTLHGLSENVRALLYIAYAAAVHMGKPVQIINHSCYPEDAPKITDPVANGLYRKVYGVIEYAAFREHITHGLMTRLGIEGALSFDSLPLTAKHMRASLPKPEGKRLVVAGSASADEGAAAAFAEYARWAATQGWTTVLLAGARAFPAADENRFIQTIARHGLPAGTELAAATSLETWMGEISRAGMVATGRFHHSIAAFSLGAPFIAAGSNTAKVHALMQLLERPQPMPINDPSLGKMLIEAHQQALDTAEGEAAHKARLDAVESLAMENYARL